MSDRVDHVRVIGEGPQQLPEARVNGWRSGPYLLVVGALAAHKNVATLVEAFGRSGLGDEFDLVLSGPPDGRAAAELRRIAVAYGVGARIEHVGFLSPQDLAAAYRNATALAFPSLIEGFGLPVLEAMRLGTPVVASGLPSVREVAGDAALFVERPLDARRGLRR